MVKKTLLSILLFFACFTVGYADVLDVVKATARVYVHKMDDGGAYKWFSGTAWLVESDYETDKEAYLITAGHILNAKDNKIKSIWIQFFYPEKTPYIIATEFRRAFHYPTTEEVALYDQGKLEEFSAIMNEDMAILKIGKEHIKDIKTRLKFKDDSVYTKGLRTISIGCQSGEWPSMIWGKIEAVFSTGFRLDASVQGGRSGSVVTDESGDYILGMVLRRDSSCVNAATIRKRLKLLPAENSNDISVSMGQGAE